MSKIKFRSASKYNITIRHTANGGCFVQIGCCELSFSSPNEMLAALKKYYDNPNKMEKEYNKLIEFEEEDFVLGPPMGL